MIQVGRVVVMGACFLALVGCQDDYREIKPAATVAFAAQLSDHSIYKWPQADLVPDSGFVLLELNSTLYSDNALKQRLIRLPEGTSMTHQGDRRPNFPDGTVLVKTFYYPIEGSESGPNLQVIETRLLVKSDGVWNAATYLWNQDQTDAMLVNDGASVNVEYLDEQGDLRALLYQVPSQRKCAKCHQSSGEMVPLGATVRNWNRDVLRDSQQVHQLAWLQAQGLLNPFDVEVAPHIPNYASEDVPLAERARAYLDLNCSSCHHPEGIEEAQGDGLDLRFETPFHQTGIGGQAERMLQNIAEGRMPDEGLVTVDEAGLALIQEYVDSL